MSKVQTVTANTIKKVVYSDFFTDFSRHAETGQLNRKTNEDAVKQSIRNLINTNFYERPMQPQIGCNIRSLLFENFTPATQLQAKKYIEELFDNHEPRAELLECIVAPARDGLSLSVTIYFRIINSTESARVDVIIERTR